MTKQKKIIAAVLVATVLLAAFGAFLGIRALLKNDIRFIVNDNLPDGEGKKATVILLGGQSNAAGCSWVEYLEKTAPPEAYEKYENGFDNVYINYYSSGLNMSNGFVKCAKGAGDTKDHFGPELGMAEKLNELYPDETFFIIKCAWSGTNLYEQWLSPSSEGKTGDLYKQFVAYVKSSVKYLESKNYDVKIEGMCWMQGESDSFSTDNAGNYGTHLENLIKDLRKKFSRYADKDGFVFVDAYIADNPVYWVYCDTVNACKAEVLKSSPRNALVDTIAVGLTCATEPEDTPDLAHYDALSEIKLGNLFIEELLRISRPE